jgi:uncharacterized membrane protein YfcA
MWSGMTGMSAAIPTSQMLSWLIGMRDIRLNASAIIVTVFASSPAILAFAQHGLIDFPVILLFAISSTMGALVGAAPLFSDIRDNRAAKLFWSASLVIIPVYVLANPHLGIHIADSSSIYPRPVNWIIYDIQAGLTAGFYGRLSSTGPACVIPAIIILLHLSVLHAIATAIVVYLIVSIPPTIVYISKGMFEDARIIWTAFGAALGGLVGSRLAIGLPQHMLIVYYCVGLLVLT